MQRRVMALLLLVGFSIFLTGMTGTAQERRGDYFPPELLDKALGIERLPNGNTLITDGGGAYYTTTDASILARLKSLIARSGTISRR